MLGARLFGKNKKKNILILFMSGTEKKGEEEICEEEREREREKWEHMIIWMRSCVGIGKVKKN